MKRFFIILQIIFIALLLSSCKSIEGKDTGSIKAPTNNLLSIEGVWKVNNIKPLDDTIVDNGEDITGENIEISNEAIKIGKNIYVHPRFKLKVVDKNYIISYESSLTMEYFMGKNDKREVISIVNNNTIVCEFILLEDNKALILYRGALLEVEKIGDKSLSNLGDEKNDVIKNSTLDLNDYDSDIGVMMALKVPRQEISEGVYSKEQYRTLWISFIEGKLQPIIEKDSIIFPRMNGIWNLKSNSFKINSGDYEYFTASPYEYENNNSNKVNSSNNIMNKSVINSKITQSVYKNIKFVGNDYISIEKYEGDNFKNSFPKYETIPIDNVNSPNGISIDEIFSHEEIQKYSIDFNTTLNKLTKEDKIKLNTTENHSNFSFSRKDGKWSLVGKISPNDGVGSGIDFPLGIKVSNKLLNYNTLGVPWKILRGELPFIKDAYTSPNGRLAIGIFKDNLAIYEIENARLKGSPIFNVLLNEGEEVIMSEWCSGSYVQEWAKAFKDGKEIID